MLRAHDPAEVYDTALETGRTATAVRMSLSRADAYDASQAADRAVEQAKAAGVTGPELAALIHASDQAYALYLSWKNATSRAAIAGALD